MALTKNILQGFIEKEVLQAKDENFEEILKEEILKLDDISKTITLKRFGYEGEPQTLLSVAEQLGMEREEVRQIEYNAYKKLVNALKTRK